uniref:SERTA domain-containing protein n=1 Tax=Oncorhynchus tshawytscha TaxID=74940 RepID=A0A8C8EJI1_ONCTS
PVGFGQKRKVDDVVGGMRSGTWESQRQSVLGISLVKYHRGQELMEPSLRRSVLIANTLRHIHLENKPPYGLDKEDVWMSSESDFSLSAAVSSILKELDLTVDGGRSPQRTPFRSIENLPGDLGLKRSWVAFGCVEEVVCSSYLQDVKLDELFHDIDTSVTYPLCPPFRPLHPLLSLNQSFRDLHELEHIMEILVES